MLNYIWCGIIMSSLIYGGCTGRIEETIAGCFSGAEDGITLVLSMIGILSFWSGLLRIAQSGGIISALEYILSPVTKRLFPNIPVGSDAMNKICANITANLFGLGNAATPFGISAIKSMKKYSEEDGVATDDMCTFIVLNTASVQLIPSTMIAMRAALGSQSPSGLIPLCWISSIFALSAGLLTIKFLKHLRIKQ